MRYARGAQTAWRRIADETVVINLGSRCMVGLNASGGAVWEALGAVPDLAALAAGLDAEAGTQLRRFIEELAAEGLAEPAGDADPSAGAALAALSSPVAPPAILWREELLRFGGACNKLPDESIFCNQNPKFS